MENHKRAEVLQFVHSGNAGGSAESKRKNPLIDMADYRFPNRSNVIPVYKPVARKSGAVTFDIYDYQMLFDDSNVKELIRKGKTIGCFYIESPGMRSLLRRLDVDSFELLTAASSIIRPGVAESGMMQEFIARHHDPKRRKYLVPEMEQYLGETYGVMIYQEDVIKVAHHIAGVSLEEADLLRRAMSGKMRSKEAMRRIQERFFESGMSRGLTKEVTSELWRQIASFAGYSFCKSHSASFALLSYQVAYLKVYYPAEFMAAVLSNRGGYYSPAVYVQECKRLGLAVKLPCINHSEYDYVGKGKEIRIGLMAIKHISRSALERLLNERAENGQYMSLADFIVRTHTGYEETAMLIRCGAMDCFGETRPTLLRLLDIYFKSRRLLDDRYTDLFMGETFKLEREVQTNREYSIQQKCLAELDAFDYMVSRHPLEFFSEWTTRKNVVTAARMEQLDGRRVTMIGWFMTSKRIKTKKGEIMKFLSLEDLTGTFEAVLFPRSYNRFAAKTMSMGPYIIEGKIDAKNGNNIIVEKLDVLSAAYIKESIQWDSSESSYQMERERVTDEEMKIVTTLGKEKLRRAYAG